MAAHGGAEPSILRTNPTPDRLDPTFVSYGRPPREADDVRMTTSLASGTLVRYLTTTVCLGRV